MQETTDLDLNKMCRTCLTQQDNMTDLNVKIVLENVQLPLKEIYLSCFKFSDNINMPLKMCSDCTILLINAFKFKMRCEKSEKYISGLLKMTGLWFENSCPKLRPSDSTSTDVEKFETITVENNVKQRPSDSTSMDVEKFETITVENNVKQRPSDSTSMDVEKFETITVEDNVKQRRSDSTSMDVEMFETITVENNVKLETISDDGLTMDENEECGSQKIFNGLQKTYSGAQIPDDMNNKTCFQCGKTYGDRKLILMHLKRVHKMKFACSICRRVFTDKKFLQMHMTYHVQFKCDICLMPFDTPVALGKHLNTKVHALLAQPLAVYRPHIDQDSPICLPNGSKEIECKLCSKQLNRLADLRIHLNVHRNPETLNDCHFDDELLKILGFRSETERQVIINRIVEYIDEENLSRFYSITNEHGLEMSISDTETDSEAENSSATRRLYTCGICNVSFNRRYKILEHQRDSHRLIRKGHLCTNCGTKFVANKLLEKHLKSQCSNTIKIFTCSECNMKFMWHKNYVAHKSRHMAAKKLGEEATIEETENEPAVGQAEDEPETDEASETLSDSDQLEGQKTVTKNSKGKIQCDRCDKTFQTAYRYKLHKQKHGRKKLSEMCFHCNFQSKKRDALASHVRRHFAKKLYKCNVCDNSYGDASDLAVHMLTHRGERSHKCEICEKAFHDYGTLFNHARSHEGEFKCQRCDSTFSRYDDLIMHTQEKHEAFRQCATCRKIYSHVIFLRRHLLIYDHRPMSGSNADLARKQLIIVLDPKDNSSANDALMEAAAGFLGKKISE